MNILSKGDLNTFSQNEGSSSAEYELTTREIGDESQIIPNMNKSQKSFKSLRDYRKKTKILSELKPEIVGGSTVGNPTFEEYENPESIETRIKSMKVLNIVKPTKNLPTKFLAPIVRGNHNIEAYFPSSSSTEFNLEDYISSTNLDIIP